jgi:hypothetical protein
MVVPSSARRDALIAVVVVLLILGFVGYGLLKFANSSQKAFSNTLRGAVLEKQFTPEHEQLISYGRKGLKKRESDGEYMLKVRVTPGNEVFEVPVDKGTYESRQVGDTLTFLRPGAE